MENQIKEILFKSESVEEKTETKKSETKKKTKVKAEDKKSKEKKESEQILILLCKLLFIHNLFT